MAKVYVQLNIPTDLEKIKDIHVGRVGEGQQTP